MAIARKAAIAGSPQSGSITMSSCPPAACSKASARSPSVELHDLVGAQLAHALEALDAASGTDDPAGTHQPRELDGHLPDGAGGAEHEHALAARRRGALEREQRGDAHDAEGGGQVARRHRPGSSTSDSSGTAARSASVPCTPKPGRAALSKRTRVPGASRADSTTVPAPSSARHVRRLRPAADGGPAATRISTGLRDATATTARARCPPRGTGSSTSAGRGGEPTASRPRPASADGLGVGLERLEALRRAPLCPRPRRSRARPRRGCSGRTRRAPPRACRAPRNRRARRRA